MLVERKTFGRGLAGETTAEITYRFGPPEGEDMLAEKEGIVIGDERNSGEITAVNSRRLFG